MATHFLACDLGAESGRLIQGSLEADCLTLEELHRFANGAREQSDGSLHWDIGALFDELKAGLTIAGSHALPCAGISTDSWGVDYVLFDDAGRTIPPTFCYRDPRSERGVRNAWEKTDWESVFAETGIQFMPINTLFQLAAEDPGRLSRAHRLLGVGDAFNFLLSGNDHIEVSMASTFQLYNPRSRGWSDKLIDALELPRGILPEIVPSGTKLGTLKPTLQEATGLGPAEVIASCSHDTGAAVAAVPAGRGNWAYLSSGTWSLIGIECPEPILTDACREHNFTNEIGVGHSVRLLKNIIGLWLVQESRRHWEEKGQELSYDKLAWLASEAAPFVSLIDPNDPRFIPPGDMPGRIAARCRETGQPEPKHPGAVIRCALESLALLYARTLHRIEDLTGEPIERLHIVGGGCRNRLLNQLTANALQKPVIAGPVEATAAGNILIQARALGKVESLDHIRRIVKNSFETETFEPDDTGDWRAARERFQALQDRNDP